MSIHDAAEWLEACEDGFTPSPAPDDPEREQDLSQSDRQRELELIRQYADA